MQFQKGGKHRRSDGDRYKEDGQDNFDWPGGGFQDGEFGAGGLLSTAVRKNFRFFWRQGGGIPNKKHHDTKKKT